MLTDPKAIAIISRARQKNVASAARSARDFERIFRDFFRPARFDRGFAGALVLDLGPGQYDFARTVRDLGGQCENIDNDPAVVELGAYLGFACCQENLKTADFGQWAGRYDGVFCKFSINAFWRHDAGAALRYPRELDRVLRPGGWGWVAPWNGRPAEGVDDDLARQLLAAQAQGFADCGWTTVELTDAQARAYGVSGRVENHALFLKNLALPEALR